VNLIQNLIVLAKNPLVVTRNKQHILYLSHMRANTSLIGHILGDNPEVEGYYEMHMGYFSWKSLVRQKLIYLNEHAAKPMGKFFFDKVLHNEHGVTDAILTHPSVNLIISIREPISTVKSIMAQYTKRNPEHECATSDGAVQYYISRLAMLCKYAQSAKGKYTFFEAEKITQQPDKTLNGLSKALSLQYPLKNEYKPRAKTGVGTSGDHSAYLKAGTIVNKKSDYSDITLSEENIESLKCSYETSLSLLIKHAKVAL